MIASYRKKDNETDRFHFSFLDRKDTGIFTQKRVKYPQEIGFLFPSSTKRGTSMSGQTFAYLRVSKLDQDLEKNKLDILKLANEMHLGHVQFIEEKVSGKVSW